MSAAATSKPTAETQQSARLVARAAFLDAAAAEPHLAPKSALGAVISLILCIFFGDLLARAVDVAAPDGGPELQLIIALATLSMLTPALLVLMPLLHVRRFSTLWGAAGRPKLRAILLGGAIAICVGAAALTVDLALGGVELRTAVTVQLIPLLVIAALVVTQATAEELFFRGYLLQAAAPLAALSPILWAAPSVLFFTFFHYSPDLPVYMLVWPLAFGALAAALVWRTGGLSLGIGFHIAHNWIALLVFSEQGGVSGVGPIRLSEDAILEILLLSEIALAALALALLYRVARPEQPRFQRSNDAG